MQDKETMAQPQRAPVPEEPHGDATAARTSADAAKRKPGAAWKDAEEHHLPENRIYVVFSGLMLCVFLAALGGLTQGFSITSVLIFSFCRSGMSILDAIYSSLMMQYNIDDRCNSTTNNRRETTGREELQLGWVVRNFSYSIIMRLC